MDRFEECVELMHAIEAHRGAYSGAEMDYLNSIHSAFGKASKHWRSAYKEIRCGNGVGMAYVDLEDVAWAAAVGDVERYDRLRNDRYRRNRASIEPSPAAAEMMRCRHVPRDGIRASCIRAIRAYIDERIALLKRAEPLISSGGFKHGPQLVREAVKCLEKTHALMSVGRSGVGFVPTHWCDTETAEEYLKATGWVRLKSSGTYKARAHHPTMASIPWPGMNPYSAPGHYDLHDLACVMGVGGSELLERIRAAGDGAA